MLDIDGTRGEGGGQILRSSLTLSLLTGRPFRITRIRGGRRKPGLLRQHLAAVRLAAAVGDAAVAGDTLGSQTLTFAPRTLVAGAFTGAVGSAGSAMLVLQTVLPALLRAAGESTVTVDGGTHNPWAPCYEFVRHAWSPAVTDLGARVELTLHRHGFFPAGGGRVSATVQPTANLGRLVRVERGAETRVFGAAVVSGHSARIAHLQRKVLVDALGRDISVDVVAVPEPRGPGNTVWMAVESEGGTQVFAEAGQRRRSPEDTARRVAGRLQSWRACGAPVGPHLADQLVLLLSLGGGGRFLTGPLTPHTRTNLDVVARFCDRPPRAVQVSAGLWEIGT